MAWGGSVTLGIAWFRDQVLHVNSTPRVPNVCMNALHRYERKTESQFPGESFQHRKVQRDHSQAWWPWIFSRIHSTLFSFSQQMSNQPTVLVSDQFPTSTQPMNSVWCRETSGRHHINCHTQLSPWGSSHFSGRPCDNHFQHPPHEP